MRAAWLAIGLVLVGSATTRVIDTAPRRASSSSASTSTALGEFKGTQFVLMRLMDGSVVTKLATAIDCVVLREDGSLAGLLAADAAVRWLAPDGKLVWTAPRSTKLGPRPRAIIAGDLLIVGYSQPFHRPFGVVAYRLQSGDVAWTRSFDEPEPDAGTHRYELSLRTKRGRLIVRSDVDGSPASLHVLDPATGASKLSL
jgi:hypothetical protein